MNTYLSKLSINECVQYIIGRFDFGGGGVKSECIEHTAEYSYSSWYYSWEIWLQIHNLYVIDSIKCNYRYYIFL